MGNRREDRRERLAVLAVLGAAAREAEELIGEDDLHDDEVYAEARRRVALFVAALREPTH